MNFEEQAATWIAWARRPLDAYWFYRDAFFELLPAPCRTLEVGCGEGRVTRDLRARGFAVTGLDAGSTLVEAARAEDPGGDYVVGEAESLPFEDASFDFVVAYNSLMDVDEMPRAVAEIGRVLTADGVLCACITHPMVDSGRWAEDDKSYVIDKPYLQRNRFELTAERPGVPPLTFSGWTYPLETYSRALEDAGLALEALREPAAPNAFVEANPAVARWQRLPNFLLFRASRSRKAR